ncbi:MAG: hypothetical protein CMC35_09215 [Flavobacteriaceae bacterium]|nr:hypothetical protein [Flavobacteriaceae bacterium]|tara:strand:+ start:24061 stop:25185 length:1125 start_codon:yes stop_codon:yes gene_type:complete
MTLSATSKKPAVCLVAISLGTGGSDRSCAQLSQMLTAEGFEVHIAVLNDNVKFDYSGSLLNLGALKKGKDTLLKRFQRMRVLKRYLKKHNIAHVIDHRAKNQFYREWFYKKFIYHGVKTIYVVHSHLLETYFGKTPDRFRALYQTNAATVTVSEAIKKTLQAKLQLRNLVCIPNAANPAWKALAKQTENPIATPYILSYGRMNDAVKDYRFLLESYAASKLYDEGIQLVLMGEGPSLPQLKQWVQTNGLEDAVQFIPPTTNPFPYVNDAICVTLTSRYEGFPMVLLEALSLEVPVVSLDIPSGPSEIIEHQKNGLLIQKREVSLFAEALRTVALDKELRLRFQRNAAASMARYAPAPIAAAWKKLLLHGPNPSK